jgi:ubiquitin-activating enzyme E1-like protein
MNFQPYFISSYQSGLKKNKKPFLILDDAFQTLENAFVYREAVKKRDGIKLVGRLRRVFTTQAVGNVTIGAGTTVFNLFTLLSITEPDASLEPGNVSTITLAFGAPFSQTFTDSTGTGVMTGFVAPITGVSINYETGDVTVINSGGGFGASALTVTVAYYPNLPVMGIDKQELAAVNVERTVFFDTKYVYVYDDNDFSSPSTTTWAGNDDEFFWMENYRGSTADARLFFVTNFASPALSVNNRIRYTSDAATWTTFTPLVDATVSIFQCKLIVSYYGRLLFLNTWEGTLAGNAVNFFNRCRFSQIGNPISVDAWRSDQFGKGGFIDAPTNEAIISARFYKNTLIIFFEKTTWQLRYVGEYGLPFVWERISSDFGSESKLSTVLFDGGILAVGDKAIVTSSGNDVQRIDLEIPDVVFAFNDKQSGKERVHGGRDFQKELVYWTYSDGPIGNKFPNRVLVYNYRNNTWAIFRDNVTCFGELTNASGDSWDLPISWDSDTSWDTFYQGEFPTLISGNHQGFVHYYQFFLDPDPVQDNLVDFREHESLYIQDITRSATDNLRIVSPDHNLEDLEIIYIANLIFVDTSTGTALTTTLNNKFYQVTVIDSDTIDLTQWDFDTEAYISTSGNSIGFTPATGTGTYMGGGVIALLPKVNILTKDFNPIQNTGSKIKSSYIDFQMDATPNAEVSVIEYIDSSTAIQANLPIWNPEMNTTTNQTGRISGATQANPCVITSPNHGLLTGRQITIGDVKGMTELNGGFYTISFLTVNTFELDGIDSSAFNAYTSGGWLETMDKPPQYVKGSAYAWHRFYSNVYGQYITIQITYDDNLMNQDRTHDSDFQMNAMTLYAKPAGRLVN